MRTVRTEVAISRRFRVSLYCSALPPLFLSAACDHPFQVTHEELVISYLAVLPRCVTSLCSVVLCLCQCLPDNSGSGLVTKPRQRLSQDSAEFAADVTPHILCLAWITKKRRWNSLRRYLPITVFSNCLCTEPGCQAAVTLDCFAAATNNQLLVNIATSQRICRDHCNLSRTGLSRYVLRRVLNVGVRELKEIVTEVKVKVSLILDIKKERSGGISKKVNAALWFRSTTSATPLPRRAPCIECHLNADLYVRLPTQEYRIREEYLGIFL
ncbi:hypothetical protein J6590_086571 [Homalodisca vitripennis]|nr:hypothetical protein J6590_086571 [Homalodisca vitripennis]